MIFQRKKLIKVRNRGIDIEDAYISALFTIIDYINRESSNKQKTALLNYYIKTIKADFISDNLVFMLSQDYIKCSDSDKAELNKPVCYVFQSYFRSDNKQVKYKDAEVVQLDVADVDILVYTTDNKKISSAIHSLKDWTSPLINEALYLRYIDLCFFKCGHHQMAVRKVLEKHCLFNAFDYDMAEAFQDVYTNGQDWLHKYSPVSEPIADHRMALLYTLAKLKYSYENPSFVFEDLFIVKQNGQLFKKLGKQNSRFVSKDTFNNHQMCLRTHLY